MNLPKTLAQYSLTTGIVKVVGFLRGIVVAAYIGASVALDVYYAALVFIGLIVFVFAEQYEMVTSQIASEAYHNQGVDVFVKLGGKIFSLSLLIGAILGISTMLLVPTALPYFVGGFQPYIPHANIRLVLILLPLAILFISYRTLLALLRACDRVGMSLLIDAIQSTLFFIFGLLIFVCFPYMQEVNKVLALAATQTLALVICFILATIIWILYTKSIPIVSIDKKLIRHFIRDSSGLITANYAFYAFTLIDRHFAAMAHPGGIALLLYAGGISLTARSLMNYEQIYILDYAQSVDRQRSYQNSLRTCIILSAPWTAYLIIFAPQLVKFIYERGAFTKEMTFLSSQLLQVYGAATTIFLMWGLCLRIIQVEGLVIRLLPWIFVGIVFDIILTRMSVAYFGLPGAILGTVLVFLFLLFCSYWILRNRRVHIINLKMMFSFCLITIMGLGFGWFLNKFTIVSIPFINLMILTVCYFSLFIIIYYGWHKFIGSSDESLRSKLPSI